MWDLTKDGWDEVEEERGGVVYIKRETTLASFLAASGSASLLSAGDPAVPHSFHMMDDHVGRIWREGREKRGGRGKAEPR